jgi:tRNA-2-methylthio-N6-dimethylallyladenosine synthase
VADDAKPTRFFIETFGCQMNVNDSEKVAGLLRAEGHLPVDDPADADFVFVNTCAVREKAADKLYHAAWRLRRARKRRPGLTIGVGGCVAQLEGAQVLERAPHIDFLVGTHNLTSIPAFLERVQAGERGLVDLDRKADAFAVSGETIAHSSPVRAFVTIMEGCNHVCSFCVVPRTRGPEVNRSPDAVQGEVRSLVERGYAEIMLLGQTVNAYRVGHVGFADLLARIDEVPGLRRLRFTTSHPEHVDEPMARTFATLRHLCPYLHLPFQSGNDQVLAAMRRGYDKGRYLEVVAMLRAHREDLALSTDVIVGYPGETEAAFLETLDLLDQVGFDGLFSFTYSPRPGTVAFSQADDVPSDEKLRRLHEVNARQQRRQAAALATRVGLVESVLVDTVAGPGRLAGRTPHYRIAHFDGPESLLGQEILVEIESSGANSLTGRLV